MSLRMGTFIVVGFIVALFSTATQASGFKVTRPIGGEVLDVNSWYTIAWDTDRLPVVRWEIWRSTDGGATYPTKLADEVPYKTDTTNWSWGWAHVGPIGQQIRVQVRAVLPRGLPLKASSGNFTIRFVAPHLDPIPVAPELDRKIAKNSKKDPLHSVTLLSPNGKEVITKGMPVSITWQSNVQAAGYGLYISTDNGKTYSVIIEDFSERSPDDAAAGSYSWMADAAMSTKCKIKIALFTPLGVVIEDESDKAFQITGDVIVPKTPTPK